MWFLIAVVFVGLGAELAIAEVAVGQLALVFWDANASSPSGVNRIWAFPTDRSVSRDQPSAPHR
jgi:hypothetical protein